MVHFLLSAVAAAYLALPFYRWSRAQTEAQIDKMQRAVHFTPGVEPPLPPSVLLAGAGLIAVHQIAARILGLRAWPAALSLLVGAIAGVATRATPPTNNT
jgi:hypothetical protein